MYCIVLYVTGYQMDVQLKKGILEICVLQAISREESYGYKIISDLSGVVELSESTLYPILKRCEAAGYLTTHTKEYSGRLRRYYKITKQGLQRLAAGKNDLLEIGFIYKKLFGGRL